MAGAMNCDHVDYARLHDYYRRHHERYKRFVEAHGLICQECGGWGGDKYSGYGDEPPEPCGFCETTGKVTPYMRGLWLRWKREDKRARRTNG